MCIKWNDSDEESCEEEKIGQYSGKENSEKEAEQQKVEKGNAIQSMGMLYSHSEFPVGLLIVCIDSEEHLNLLIKLLKGRFLKDRGECFSHDLGRTYLEMRPMKH